MEDAFAICISLAALIVSVTHVWWAHFRNGTVQMTRPTMVFLGPDGADAFPKVFLRTLVFSTAQRGCVIENMYLRLTGGGRSQTFSFWAYAENHDKPSRGSGLFVGPQGCTYNHHFVVPKSAAAFEFPIGQIQIEVFTQVLGKENPIRVQAFCLNSPDKSDNGDNGLMFDWNPELQTYEREVHSRPDRRNGDFDSMALLAAFSGQPGK